MIYAASCFSKLFVVARIHIASGFRYFCFQILMNVQVAPTIVTEKLIVQIQLDHLLVNVTLAIPEMVLSALVSSEMFNIYCWIFDT